MKQVVIYLQDSGVPAVVYPTQEALKTYGIQAIAEKDVPEGKPFKILDAEDLPQEPQEAWIVDVNDLTDGVGSSICSFEDTEFITPKVS